MRARALLAVFLSLALSAACATARPESDAKGEERSLTCTGACLVMAFAPIVFCCGPLVKAKPRKEASLAEVPPADGTWEVDFTRAEAAAKAARARLDFAAAIAAVRAFRATWAADAEPRCAMRYGSTLTGEACTNSFRRDRDKLQALAAELEALARAHDARDARDFVRGLLQAKVQPLSEEEQREGLRLLVDGDEAFRRFFAASFPAQVAVTFDGFTPTAGLLLSEGLKARGQEIGLPLVERGGRGTLLLQGRAEAPLDPSPLLARSGMRPYPFSWEVAIQDASGTTVVHTADSTHLLSISAGVAAKQLKSEGAARVLRALRRSLFERVVRGDL